MMNKLMCVLILAIGSAGIACSQVSKAEEPDQFIPEGVALQKVLRGDLNQNDRDDYVFLVKGEEAGESEQSRRGLVIVFNDEDGYELALSNLESFSSGSDDGGVYIAPELGLSIEDGSLFIRYFHGRYGNWAYNFRYQNGDFELIGFDRSENRGPVVERDVSINLLSQRMRIRENTNVDAEGGDEVFDETWKGITLNEPIRLSRIDDFDSLDVKEHLVLELS